MRDGRALVTPRAKRYKDPDVERLVVELATAVRSIMKQRGAPPRKPMPVPLTTLYGLLRHRRVSLDTYIGLARWAGYDVALIPRGET